MAERTVQLGLGSAFGQTEQQRGRPRRLRVFLADDDAEMRALLASVLRRDGYEVFESHDGSALASDLGCALWHGPLGVGDAVIVADARMPRRGGLSLLRGMRYQPDCPPFILITAFGDEGLHAEARALGVHAVLDKPFDLDELRGLLRDLAER